jgi:hypothetical protein
MGWRAKPRDDVGPLVREALKVTGPSREPEHLRCQECERRSALRAQDRHIIAAIAALLRLTYDVEDMSDATRGSLRGLVSSAKDEHDALRDEITRLQTLLGEATRRLDLAQSTLSIIAGHPNYACNDTAQWMADKSAEALGKDFAAQDGQIMSWMTHEHYKRSEKKE